MEPQASFRFGKQGIEIDESLGYPDAVGYRAGIAGRSSPLTKAVRKRRRLPACHLLQWTSNRRPVC